MILIFLDDAQWVKVECCTLESISYYSISVKWSRSELEDGRRPSSSELLLIRGIYEDNFLNINESPKSKVLKNTITPKSHGVNIFAQIAETPQATRQSLIVFTCQAGCWIVSLAQF